MYFILNVVEFVNFTFFGFDKTNGTTSNWKKFWTVKETINMQMQLTEWEKIVEHQVFDVCVY